MLNISPFSVINLNSEICKKQALANQNKCGLQYLKIQKSNTSETTAADSID
jgi:hypothetical protein